MADGQLVSTYRVPAELTAIDSSEDGTCIALGTVDGCLTCLTVADPKVTAMTGYVTRLPSRSEIRSPSRTLIQAESGVSGAEIGY